MTLSDRKDRKSVKSDVQPKEVEVETDGSMRIEEEDSIELDGETGYYSDTLVMKTVGYWQLRANPGVWDLNIDKNSRGSEIFDMVDGKIQHGMVRLSGVNASSNTKRLVMGDFVSHSETQIVKRRSGYEKASLFYNKKTGDGDGDSDDEVINVFSLATGHACVRAFVEA